VNVGKSWRSVSVVSGGLKEANGYFRSTPLSPAAFLVMSQYKRTSTQPGPKTSSDAELVPSEYRRDAEKLRELFPSWTAAGVYRVLGTSGLCFTRLNERADLASVLAEVGGDVSTAVAHITEGEHGGGQATRAQNSK